MLNDQRKVIFEQRKEIMEAEDVSDQIAEFRAKVIDELVARHIPEKAYAEQWDAAGLQEEIESIFGLDLPVIDWAKEEGIADEEVRERITKAVETRAAERAANFGPDVMRYVEKTVLLQTLDHNWREHIVNLDHLRQYVGLRGYGQRDPLNEYKQEAFALFEALLSKLRSDVVRQLMQLQINVEQPPQLVEPSLQQLAGHARRPAHRRGRVRSGRQFAIRPSSTAHARCAGRSQQSGDLGQGPAQRALPVRLGPQVQALPRRAGLTAAVARLVRERGTILPSSL